MKVLPLILLLALMAGCSTEKSAEAPLYPGNRAPLRANPFLELPLGAIEP